MTPDEAIAIVRQKANGRTRYEGQPPFLDEVLVEEIKRLRALLEPCRHDTDPQTDSGYPRTINDVLSLLSAYIADVMPPEAVPGDEYFGAWEREARKVIEPLMQEIERLRVALKPFAAVARGLPDNWPGHCRVRVDWNDSGEWFSYHGSEDAGIKLLPTIDQWREAARAAGGSDDAKTP